MKGNYVPNVPNFQETIGESIQLSMIGMFIVQHKDFLICVNKCNNQDNNKDDIIRPAGIFRCYLRFCTIKYVLCSFAYSCECRI